VLLASINVASTWSDSGCGGSDLKWGWPVSVPALPIAAMAVLPDGLPDAPDAGAGGRSVAQAGLNGSAAFAENSTVADICDLSAEPLVWHELRNWRAELATASRHDFPR
jgi:hypothetical protein